MIKEFYALEDAASISLQRLCRNYLVPDGAHLWTVENACITARRTWNRCGVPADAETYRYLVQHPDHGWSFAFRAVWRAGALMKPAVHVAIEDTFDDDGIGQEALLALINDWLRSL